MALPLLTTKLHMPPPQDSLVARPRLVEQLDGALQRGHRLVLASAPAGSGKTTVLSAWLAPRRAQTAWVSLDDGENDPIRFLSYVIAGLQRLDTEIPLEGGLPLGERSRQVLSSPQPLSFQAILIPLLNEIANLKSQVVLVLDDYHLIANPAIHQGIEFLLEHQPEQLLLVLASRADPPLALSRLRARRQVTELRVEDLRFRTDEVAALMNTVMGLDLPQEDIDALHTRTEGWIAGLQLAALSIQGRDDRHAIVQGFSGSHHYIVEYLTEEVLQGQPQEVQTFLMRTCLLERLCGPLCDAVRWGADDPDAALAGSTSTVDRDGQAMLAHLYRANLFVLPLDDQQSWYRYHRLFADILRARLERQATPGEIHDLYRRASAWHEQDGTVDEAIQYAVLAGDHDQAVRLIEQNAPAAARSEPHSLFAWVELIPESLVRRRPLLCIVRAWTLTFTGRFDEVEAWLEHAEQNMVGDPGQWLSASPGLASHVEQATTTSLARYVQGNIHAMRAFIADRDGQIATAVDLARRADALLPANDLGARVFVPYILGRSHLASGELEQAEDACVELERLGQASGNILTVALARCELAALRKIQGRLGEAEILYQGLLREEMQRGGRQIDAEAIMDIGYADLLREQNEPAGARQRAQNVLESLKADPWWGAPTNFALAYTTLARVLQAEGDLDGAFAVLEDAAQAHEEYNVFPAFQSEIDTCQVRLWLAGPDPSGGDEPGLDQALSWAGTVRERDEPGPDLLTWEEERMALARVLVARGKREPGQGYLVDVVALLGDLARRAESGGRLGRLIEIWIVQAMALQARGSQAEAVGLLQQALALAEPEGYLSVFLDEGPPMASLLQALAARGRTQDYVGRLLAAFRARQEGAPERIGGPPTAPTTPTQLIESLTGRELEVLALISQGYSNRQIAEALVVSVNTVKRHTSNLYGKLAVGSRTQAIACAQELGLLD
jgi:LuxR family maltose regulon positive regulatory protein